MSWKTRVDLGTVLIIRTSKSYPLRQKYQRFRKDTILRGTEIVKQPEFSEAQNKSYDSSDDYKQSRTK